MAEGFAQCQPADVKTIEAEIQIAVTADGEWDVVKFDAARPNKAADDIVEFGNACDLGNIRSWKLMLTIPLPKALREVRGALPADESGGEIELKVVA